MKGILYKVAGWPDRVADSLIIPGVLEKPVFSKDFILIWILPIAGLSISMSVLSVLNLCN